MPVEEEVRDETLTETEISDPVGAKPTLVRLAQSPGSQPCSLPLRNEPLSFGGETGGLMRRWANVWAVE
jgi:hypothetical protein